MVVQVPDFAWGSSGYKQDRSPGFFKVQTLMTISLGTNGVPDARLTIPVHVVHPAAAISSIRARPVLGPGEAIAGYSFSQLRALHKANQQASQKISPHPISPVSPVRSGSQGGMTHTLAHVISPTPVRKRSGSSEGLGPFSEDVRYLEDVVAKEDYVISVVPSPVRPFSPSSAERNSPTNENRTRSDPRVWSKGPQLAARRLIIRHPPPLAQDPHYPRTPPLHMPRTSPYRPIFPQRTVSDSPVVQDDEDDEDIVLWNPTQAALSRGAMPAVPNSGS